MGVVKRNRHCDGGRYVARRYGRAMPIRYKLYSLAFDQWLVQNWVTSTVIIIAVGRVMVDDAWLMLIAVGADLARMSGDDALW